MKQHHLTVLAAGLLAGWLCACRGTVPSAQVHAEVQLPRPEATDSAPAAERLTQEGNGNRYTLNPRTLIPIAFNLQPDIKSSYQRFKSEEARYDFFYVSRDSVTPQLSVSEHAGEERDYDTEAGRVPTRWHQEKVGLSLEKRFFDTTEVDLGVGMRAYSEEGQTGDRPYMSGSLRYPLWASRERLGRTSEEIFRRNELNDAQLAYIQTVRNRLESAMKKYYEVVYLTRQVGLLANWLNDLQNLSGRLEEIEGRDTTSDRLRLEAELTRVNSLVRNQTGWREVQLARLKQLIGLPFHAHVEIEEAPFNPFENAEHAELLARSIETDPEISTLRNAMRNAEVQYDLARKGRWDIVLKLSGQSDLEGNAADDGNSDWSVNVGLDVSAVDPRVTDSLMRQAQANMGRFREAIAGRENAIFTDTLEPLVRLETLGQSRLDTLANLPRYEQDYRNGLEDYLAGNLNIDDLLTRRNNLYGQENEAGNLAYLLGANVAELCAATGRFFDLLEREQAASGS